MVKRMKRVVIYGFKGTFIGNSEYDYTFPNINDTHKCMLFLSQNSEELIFDAAEKECNRYGFSNIENMRANLLKVEVLNTDQYRGFTGFYEEALSEGSALVYYPNT